MDRSLAVVIMAAGKGTRMNNPHMAKVMYTINHRPMVDYVVDLALQLKSSKTVVIVGWQKEMVMRHFTETHRPVICVEQSPQMGTGHAVMQARDELEGFSGDLLVLSGDVPLLSYATTRALVDYHRAEQSTATVLTAVLKDPSGYGRILRRSDGSVTRIVEHKDATEKERHVREINSGIYVFDKERLFEGLAHITPSNAQNEYYLTDVFEYFRHHRFPVHALATESPLQVVGINTPAQLDEARTLMAPSP